MLESCSQRDYCLMLCATFTATILAENCYTLILCANGTIVQLFAKLGFVAKDIIVFVVAAFVFLIWGANP